MRRTPRRATLLWPMIDLRYVKKLIEMLDESSVDSIEISSDKGMKIRISKSPQQRGARADGARRSPMPPMLAPPMIGASHRRRPTASPAIDGVRRAAGSRRVGVLEVKSPMVGTYYAAPEPGAKPYVAVGDAHLEGADPLHHRGDEDHERDRVRVRGRRDGGSRVQDAQPVEYGQVLFRIDPNG